MLLVALPRLLRELLEKAFAERPHYRLLRADSLDGLAETVEAERPDYIVAALEDDDLPAACRQFLDDRARVEVLGIGEREGNALLIRLRPTEREVKDTTPRELVRLLDTVRAERVS